MRFKIIEFAINNQRFFNSLAFIILVMGIFFYFKTQKDVFPEIKESYVNVQVIYPGASAEKIQQQIITPIENEISILSEIKTSSSISRKNVGFTQFLVDRKYYDQLSEVRQLIQNKVDSLAFPEEVFPPKISTYTLKNEPFIYLFIDNKNKNRAYEISKYLEKDLQYIENLEQPIIQGREEYQYQIIADPQKLAKRGISLGEIFHVIDQSKTDIPSGSIQNNVKKNMLTVTSMINDISSLKNIVIRANELGDSVLLKDVADVKFDFAPATSFHSLNMKDGIIFGITKNEFGDILSLKKTITKLVNEYKEKYPDIQFELFSDSSDRISSRIKLINENLTIGLILVFLVLLFFFNFSTALWTTTGVPVSFCIGLITAILIGGTNINTIMLIGFLIILGVVVDDGIVFSENAYRHFEMGKSARQAVIDGMGEVAMSVVFATLTTIASVSAQLSLGGKIGDFARPLPIVIICTLIGSLFETLFILPGHLEHAFSHMNREKNKNSIKNRMFTYLQQQYKKILTVLVINRKKSFFSIFALICLLTGLMFTKIPFVFYAGPPKNILVFFDTPAGSALQNTKNISGEISRYLIEYPDQVFENVYTISGLQNEDNKVLIKGDIKDSISPKYSWLDMKQGLKDFIASQNFNITNFRFNVIGEDSFYLDKLEIVAKGTNRIEVLKLAKDVQEFLKTQPNIDSPRLNISEKSYNQDININARRAKTYGITPKEIAQNISMAYEGAIVGSIFSNGLEYDIKMLYDKKYHTYESLTNMRIPNKYARFVSLNEMVTIKPSMIETDIYSENGLYSIKISDSLHETSILSNNSMFILDNVQKRFSDYTNNNLSASLYFEQESSEVAQGVKEISFALFIGVSLVLLILLYLFNSFISTFLALAGIPFILFGLTIGLFVLQLPLSNMALIGMIALLGLVVNDSIVLLEHLYGSLSHDKPFIEDLVEHVSTRFRPLMMTLTTTLVGVAPLAFGFAGNEYLLQPLAVVIFFGVLVVTLITLILLPLIISMLEIDGGGLFFKYYRSSISSFFKQIGNHWKSMRSMRKKKKLSSIKE
ncbi:MAG: efflux RND transporter permease subunit [Brevinemataceae bacterium]